MVKELHELVSVQFSRAMLIFLSEGDIQVTFDICSTCFFLNFLYLLVPLIPQQTRFGAPAFPFTETSKSQSNNSHFHSKIIITLMCLNIRFASSYLCTLRFLKFLKFNFLHLTVCSDIFHQGSTCLFIPLVIYCQH